MKIALLAPANSIHTQRWANGLAARGLEIHLVSIHLSHEIKWHQNVHLHFLTPKAPLGYFLTYKKLEHLLKILQPDILHAHYATGYGFLARLSRFYPLLLSVWGSDVYDFPKKSIFHRHFLRSNLSAADAIASTSHCMAEQTRTVFAHPKMFVTPFGIDTDIFQPKISSNDISGKIRIGTIKTLEYKYGIDTLIQAFSLVKNKTNFDISLEITGGGSQLEALKKLADSLNISADVIFHGQIPHSQVPTALHDLDIYVALSRLESFGVAALEAGACALPVVVSNAEGLAEVVIDNHTGFIVPKNDPQAAANALLKLIENPQLRKSIGTQARDHVLEYYTWKKSLDKMLNAYHALIKSI